jgi:hypothetical protein
MRGFLCLLLPMTLAAQAEGLVQGPVLELRTRLGSDPLARIQLAPQGCFLPATAQDPAPKTRQHTGEATVEVWDFALRDESPREAGFRLFFGDLRQRLSRALAVPLPDHGQTELAILAGCVASQGNTVGVDMIMVQSLQERFNRCPPNGSPAR